MIPNSSMLTNIKVNFVCQVKKIKEYILYLSNKFTLPVHAEVAPTFCSSYPHATAKRVRLHKQASCQKKNRKSSYTRIHEIIFF